MAFGAIHHIFDRGLLLRPDARRQQAASRMIYCRLRSGGTFAIFHSELLQPEVFGSEKLSGFSKVPTSLVLVRVRQVIKRS